MRLCPWRTRASVVGKSLTHTSTNDDHGRWPNSRLIGQVASRSSLKMGFLSKLAARRPFRLQVTAKPTFRQFGSTFPDSRFYVQVDLICKLPSCSTRKMSLSISSPPPSASPNACAVPLRSSFFRLLTWFSFSELYATRMYVAVLYVLRGCTGKERTSGLQACNLGVNGRKNVLCVHPRKVSEVRFVRQLRIRSTCHVMLQP